MAKTIRMRVRVDMEGTLLNAAECIRRMNARMQESGNAIGEGEQFQPSYYIFALEEMAKHARMVSSGQGKLEDFAELYCLVLQGD